MIELDSATGQVGQVSPSGTVLADFPSLWPLHGPEAMPARNGSAVYDLGSALLGERSVRLWASTALSSKG